VGEEGYMKNILKQVRCFWEDDTGQSTTEYILILSVVVMVALQFKAKFSKQLSTLIEGVGGQLSKGIADDGGSP
jgi:Flp pilus assembly pilin Flp